MPRQDFAFIQPKGQSRLSFFFLLLLSCYCSAPWLRQHFPPIEKRGIMQDGRHQMIGNLPLLLSLSLLNAERVYPRSLEQHNSQVRRALSARTCTRATHVQSFTHAAMLFTHQGQTAEENVQLIYTTMAVLGNGVFYKPLQWMPLIHS